MGPSCAMAPCVRTLDGEAHTARHGLACAVLAPSADPPWREREPVEVGAELESRSAWIEGYDRTQRHPPNGWFARYRPVRDELHTVDRRRARNRSRCATSTR